MAKENLTTRVEREEVSVGVGRLVIGEPYKVNDKPECVLTGEFEGNLRFVYYWEERDGNGLEIIELPRGEIVVGDKGEIKVSKGVTLKAILYNPHYCKGLLGNLENHRIYSKEITAYQQFKKRQRGAAS